MRTSSTSKGLKRYAKAPSLRAATASADVPYPVMTITTVSGAAAFTWRRISMPSPSGSRTSVRIMSTAQRARAAAASARLPAVRTSKPSFFSRIARTSRMDCSSSTIRILFTLVPPAARCYRPCRTASNGTPPPRASRRASQARVAARSTPAPDEQAPRLAAAGR